MQAIIWVNLKNIERNLTQQSIKHKNLLLKNSRTGKTNPWWRKDQTRTGNTIYGGEKSEQWMLLKVQEQEMVGNSQDRIF